MRRRRVFLCAIVLVLGYALLCGAGGLFVAEAALHPGRRVLLDSDRQHAELTVQRHDSSLQTCQSMVKTAAHCGDGFYVRAKGIAIS